MFPEIVIIGSIASGLISVLAALAKYLRSRHGMSSEELWRIRVQEILESLEADVQDLEREKRKRTSLTLSDSDLDKTIAEIQSSLNKMKKTFSGPFSEQRTAPSGESGGQ